MTIIFFWDFFGGPFFVQKMDEREKAALAKAGQKTVAVGGLVCAFIIRK
jgi:hypothetical protein